MRRKSGANFITIHPSLWGSSPVTPQETMVEYAKEQRKKQKSTKENK